MPGRGGRTAAPMVESPAFEEGISTIQDHPDWRRHRGACLHYRERWSAEDEPGDEGCVLLYQVICLMNTPPETLDEQQRCLCTTSGCWRLPESNPRTSRRGATARVQTPPRVSMGSTAAVP